MRIAILKSEYFLALRISLFLILGIGLIRWQENLRNQLEDTVKEYQVNLDLSRHKGEHLSAFNEILKGGKLPGTRHFLPNEWIQLIQKMVSEERLLLQELKPVPEKRKGKENGDRLLLVVEGRMANLLSFFYRIATADHLIYARAFSMEPAQEGSDSVRAQITLAEWLSP